MSPTKQTSKPEGANHLMDSIESIERSSLDAMRRMADSIDGAIPVVIDSAPRRKIIDSAFHVAEQVVDASNQFTRSVLKLTKDEVEAMKSATTRAPKSAD